ncbi:MAG: tetratricopeptide repeat protein [Cyanobacteria bacterium J06639_14]
MNKSLKFLALPLAVWACQSIVMRSPIHAQSGMEALEDFAYWQRLCSLQTQAGSPEEALAACEQAIALEPEDETIWAEYSYALLTLEQYPETLAAAERVLTFNDENSLAMTYQCIAYQGLDFTEAALDACDRALQVNRYWGNRPPTLAWRTRGQILNQMGQTDQALIAYDRALHFEPDDSLTLAYRCQTLVESTNYQQGINACEAALNSNGDWLTESPALAWAYKGQARAHLGEHTAAIAAYDQAVAIQPEEPEHWLQQGWLLEQTGNFAAASLSYGRAVELVPNSSRGLVGQCHTLNQQAQYEQALAACEQAIAGDGDWWPLGAAQAWHGRAHAMAGLGEYESALGAIDRALGIRPAYWEARSDQAVILWYLGEYDRARRTALQVIHGKEIVEVDPETATDAAIAAVEIAAVEAEAVEAEVETEVGPNDAIIANTWATLGRIYRSQGRNDKAIEAYDQAIALGHQSSDTWSNLSAALWKEGRYTEALTASRRAILLDNQSVQAWQNQGAALARLGDYEAAQFSYEQALELDDQKAEIWASLGAVQLQSEDEDTVVAAVESLKRAIQLDPQQPLARSILEMIEKSEQ